jgi:hypothetical protein
VRPQRATPADYAELLVSVAAFSGERDLRALHHPIHRRAVRRERRGNAAHRPVTVWQASERLGVHPRRNPVGAGLAGSGLPGRSAAGVSVL